MPLFGAYIWSLYLEPPALARVVPFFGICSKAPNKGTKWCLYLVPSWLGALLSGAFLKIRCGVVAPRPLFDFGVLELVDVHLDLFGIWVGRGTVKDEL